MSRMEASWSNVMADTVGAQWEPNRVRPFSSNRPLLWLIVVVVDCLPWTILRNCLEFKVQ